MRVLFLITARGGSQGIPRKNLLPIAGIPLVGYKAISARRSRYCARVVCSSESAEIQDLARRYGADVPFTRPAELATDDAPTAAVIQHAMTWLEDEAGETYDAVMLLEPTSPFARHIDYDAAVELMMARDANVVLSVSAARGHPVFTGPLDARGRMPQIVDQIQTLGARRRQELSPAYAAHGAVYLFRWDTFRTHGSFYHDGEGTYAYVMDPYYAVEIDEPIDLQWAEFLVDRGYVDLSYWLWP